MANKADHREDIIFEDRSYDGIREYDNPMPGWWLWIFWASIIWTPLYIVGVHVLDVIPTYEEDLAQGQAEIQAIREAYAEANPAFDATPEGLATFVSDQAQVQSGAQIFKASCAACHGTAGEGLIGPNLTDAYWIHGSTASDLFEVVTNGVVEKGMAPWGAVLSAEQRAQVVAFVLSIVGTDPPNAKAPEGTLSERAET